VTGNGNRHCEERSDEAIWKEIATPAWGVAQNPPCWLAASTTKYENTDTSSP